MNKLMTPIRTIREKCLDCCHYQRKEVKQCGAKACACWPYRHGHRPTQEDAQTYLHARANRDEKNRLMQESLKESVLDQ